MRFLLGTHRPHWLALRDVPLFVSDRTLRRYKTLPVASCDWACDSGGFSQLSQCGTWACGPSPRDYAARIRRYRDEIGRLLWAAPQDHMVEAKILSRTGLDVARHQELTVSNYLELRSLDAELPFIPILQGQSIEDYHRCADRYEQRGVDLAAAPLVGVGSICRRQHTAEVEGIVRSLAQRGYRLHAFGAKTLGLARYADIIASSDSLAWSFAARWQPPLPDCRGHRRCNNCVKFALRWRRKILMTIESPETMALPQCSSMVVSYSDTVRHLLFAAGVTGGFAVMAQKVLVEMVDDIDGGVANQTVPFGLDGVSYEIDLSDANAAALRDVLARYIAAGRRIGGRKVRLAAGESAQAKKSGGTASDRERTRQIRGWANANGYTVSERGRLPSEVIEAFEANDGQPIVVDEPAPPARKRAPRKKVAAAKK